MSSKNVGTTNPNYKHGLKNTRLFSIWSNMKTRCYNSNATHFKYYGNKGIKICEEWRDNFKNFYHWSMENGYSDDLTLDRIDVNGNYEPGNCRWATAKEQANNTTRNVIISINGESKTLMEWCEYYEINYKTVRDRLKRGWLIEKALKYPVINKFKGELIEIDGQLKNLNEWCKYFNINRSTVRYRIKKGYTVEKALKDKVIARWERK